MNFSLTISSAPAAEPVTLAEAQASLEIASGFADDKLSDAIVAAREDVEIYLNRALINQELTMTLNHWPYEQTIYLPKSPVQSVTSLTYIDSSGVNQTLVEDTDYRVIINGDKARITPINGWPVLGDRIDSITIVYAAGYGVSGTSVPASIRNAILMHVDWQFSKGEITDMNWKKMCDRYITYFDWHTNE